jgi:hypothetical protein
MSHYVRRAVLALSVLFVLALATIAWWVVTAQRDLARARLRYVQEVGPLTRDRDRRDSSPALATPAPWRAAAALVEPPTADLFRTRADDLTARGTLGEEIGARVQPCLVANRQALVRVAEAAADREPRRIDLTTGADETGVGAFLPHARLVSLLRLATYQEVKEGRIEAATDLARMMGLATQVADNDPNLVAALISTLAHALRLDVVRTLASDSRCQQTCLDELADSLSRTEPPRPRQILATESALMIESFREQTTADRLSQWLPGGPAETETQFLDLWRGLTAVATVPYAQMDGQIATLETSRRARTGQVIAQILIPNLLDVVRKLRRVEVAHNLAITAIRVRRTQLETGLPPEPVADNDSQTATIVYRHDDLGRLVIEVPAVLADLSSALEGDRTARERLFRWTI